MIMEWWKRLDCDGKNVLKICATWIMVAVVFCTIVTCCGGCTSPRTTANAAAINQQNETLKALEYKNQLYGDMLRAYNHLLHRVWLDNPTYVEEVLTESDEFCELDDMLGGQWEDTFRFYDTEDSIQYHLNWDAKDGVIHVVKHVVNIPEPTKSRLKQVFGDEDF